MKRRILHLSVPQFAVEVERVVDPSLRTRPVAIATSLSGDGRILECSQEARRDQIFVSMSIEKALKLLPQLVVLPYNAPLYRRAYHALLRECQVYSPLIEPYQHGHAYLEISGMERLMGRSVDIAYRLCKEIRKKLRIPPQSGIGSNKLISRVADRVTRSEPVFEVFEERIGVFYQTFGGIDASRQVVELAPFQPEDGLQARP